MTKPRGKTIRVKELRLQYLDWGEGGDKTILLLRGLMAHAHVWEDLALELSSRYHVLDLDQRGHGDSAWSKETSYGMDKHFTDLSIFTRV